MAGNSHPYKEMRTRRKELMAQMEPNSIALVPSAPPSFRNNDAEYLYRQNSDFYYLTGFAEEHALLALIPGRKPESLMHRGSHHLNLSVQGNFGSGVPGA